MIQLTCTVSHSVCARVLGGDKADPRLSQSPIFLLYNMQSVELVSQLKNPSWVKQTPTQWRWHLYCIAIQGEGLQVTLRIAAGTASATEQYPKLSGIFFCLFIPWICFTRQALYSEMAACVFRARLHQQLIQTALIFSAPI